MPDATTLSKDHYLDLDDGIFSGTSKNDLDKLFSTLADDPRRDKLVVHFHGGNVTRQEGLTIAQRLLTVYRNAGAYPVFFVWRSGISEMLEKMQDRFSRPLQQAKALLDWKTWKELFTPQPRLFFRLYHAPRRVAYALYRIFMRLATGRWHGFRATLVEEFLRAFYVADFGAAVWYLMKREIIHAFGPDENNCGGTAFLLGLKKLCEENRCPQRIILIAHSGGSLYVCHFLQHAAKHVPDLKFDVIFLAAAVTAEQFSETLTRNGAQIANFRSFALKDTCECSDKLISFIYPRSLLYFMSGVCEQDDKDATDIGDVPLAGMQRYYENATVYTGSDEKKVRCYLDQKPEHAVWSIEDSGNGRRSNTTIHVGFDSEPQTIISIQHIIRNGF